MRELGLVYEQVRGRIAELASDLDGESASSAVPACPEWSVRDVIAHVVGNCTDIMTGNIEGAATDAWTAAQVEARRAKTLAEILAEWQEVGPQIAAVLDGFPGRYGDQIVADVAVHEHDVRGALGRPGARDSEGVAIGIEFLVNALLHPAMTTFGLGPLEVRAGERVWTVGTGDPPTGDLDAWLTAAGSTDAIPIPATEPVGTLSAEPFELFRAITGRRSAAQIRSFDWSVDPEPFLPTFGFGPFTIRPTDLSE